MISTYQFKSVHLTVIKIFHDTSHNIIILQRIDLFNVTVVYILFDKCEKTRYYDSKYI